MSLEALAQEYRASAEPIRQRLREIRRLRKQAATSDERLRLQYRELRLTQMLHQLNQVAELLEHYYERSYYRNENYRI